DRGPAPLESIEGLGIDRDTDGLHLSDSGHVPASQDCPGEIQLREHGSQEPAQSNNVALAINQERLPLGLAPGSAPGGQLLEALLLGSSKSVQVMPGHGSQEAGPVRESQAVGPIPELNEQVEDSSGERPVESQETAQLGRSEIAHEK